MSEELLSDEEILQIREQFRPKQGQRFDFVGFARAVLEHHAVELQREDLDAELRQEREEIATMIEERAMARGIDGESLKLAQLYASAIRRRGQ